MIHTLQYYTHRLLFVDFLRFVLFIVYVCVCVCVLGALRCVVTIILHTHKSDGERPTSSAQYSKPLLSPRAFVTKLRSTFTR